MIKKGFLVTSLFMVLSTAAYADWKMDIINEIREVYSPMALGELGLPLQIKIKEDASVAASADYGYEMATVEVYTGLLSSPRLTPDSLRMIICHELGHLFGLAPRKNTPPEWDGPVDVNGMSFLSAEGQADYYAGNVCFRKITGSQTSESQIAKAGLEFLTLVRDFPISINTPDQSISPVLIRDSYPERQCRLDTIIAGSKNLPRPACWFL